jgi:4-carboxymuconolactone decarboxylase
MLLSPPLGRALQAVGAAVRYGGALTNRAREMAILIAGHAWQSEFEIYAHVAVGRAAGLDDAELHAVSEHDYGRFADDYERLVADTAHALATRSDLTDDEYAAARDGLGLPVLFELTTLIGYYSTLALQLRIFRVGVPDDEPLRRDDD